MNGLSVCGTHDWSRPYSGFATLAQSVFVWEVLNIAGFHWGICLRSIR